MKHYLYFWRLGWVAVVVLFLCGIGINLVGRAAVFIVSGQFQLRILGEGDLLEHLAAAGAAFLLIGLPYAGWVFSLGVRKAGVLVRPPRNDPGPGDEN